MKAERASQLVEDYGANSFQLKAFSNWSRDETPNFYVKLGMKGIEQMHGVKTAEEPQPSPIREPLSISEPQPKREESSPVVEPKKKEKDYRDLLDEVMRK